MLLLSSNLILDGAHYSVVRHCVTDRKVASSSPVEVDFSSYLILPATYGTGVEASTSHNPAGLDDLLHE
jgi:hypothetical protein